MPDNTTPERGRAGRQPNRLIHEKSPYLLQHAHNPVNWFPWGEEAFEKARQEDKPVLLSIGYSTCHWCHVMEHESFEDVQVAALMNDAFVNIKVDREERPDIDQVYMTVAQMMTGRGGWPLTIIMTPDKVPFFAGTYIPKESRWGQVGMVSLIPAIRDRWRTQRDEVLDIANQVSGALQQLGQAKSGELLTEGTMELAFKQLSERFDAQHGGFGTAPKFPTAHNLLFLLRYWKRTGNIRALQMVEQTLQAMRRGGLFDQIGFGFHRYSTDRRWLLPHFEKMLYDQAMLVLAYTEAYQETRNEACRRTAEQVLEYVLRDMTGKAGEFHAAEDADSEGEEGKFYVWSLSELRDVLDEDDAELFADAFGVEPGGNYADEGTQQRTGMNILHLPEPVWQVARRRGLNAQELAKRLEAGREKLFARRGQRVRPLKDDKVLTDWNGLMIAALATAARAFDQPRYSGAAAGAAAFILEHMVDGDGRLLHRYRDGESAVQAYAADYAFLIWGLLELHQATFDPGHLEQALSLNVQLIEHYWDTENGAFFATSDDAEQLLVRQKQAYDGAVPSCNSVALLNLLRIARLTGDVELEQKAVNVVRAFSSTVQESPTSFTHMLVGVDYALGPSREVVVVGERGAEDTVAMLSALQRSFLPNTVVLYRPSGESPHVAQLAELTEHHPSIEGRATAYVCRQHRCESPTTDIDVMLDLLGVTQPQVLP